MLLDFYGTVVHEDDVAIRAICEEVARFAEKECDWTTVATEWWRRMSPVWFEAHGPAFQTQRDICRLTLHDTIREFASSADVDGLSAQQFAFWRSPPLFDDAREFLTGVSVPVCVVSNIDRIDVEAAIDLHGLRFDAIVTSDDVKAYKPRREMFAAGLAALGLATNDVLHVGDSPTNDVRPASSFGIRVAWVDRNRRSRASSSDVADLKPDFTVHNLRELLPAVSSRLF